jgi:hypothetical protein
MARRMEYLRIFFYAAWGLYAAGCVLKTQPQPVSDILAEISHLEKVAQESREPEERAEANLNLARLYRNHRNPQINYEKSREALEKYLILAPVQGKTDEVLDWLTAFREMEGLQNDTEKKLRMVDHLKRQKETREKSFTSQMKGQEHIQTDIQRLQARLEAAEKAVLGLQTENEELRGANRSLRETNSGLIEANKSLQGANQQMRATIERLKILDKQMEERREKVR